MTVLSFDGLEFEWVEMESGRVAVGVDEVVKYLDGNIKHISRYVRDIFPDYKFQWSAGVSGRPKWYVYEPGVYQLIFSSSLATISPPKVERFQRWVFSDVLPNIRKHGGYISPTATSEQLKALQEQITDLQAQNKILSQEHLYKQAVVMFCTEYVKYQAGKYVLFGKWVEAFRNCWENLCRNEPAYQTVPMPDMSEIAVEMDKLFQADKRKKKFRIHFDDQNGYGDLENAMLAKKSEQGSFSVTVSALGE